VCEKVVSRAVVQREGKEAGERRGDEEAGGRERGERGRVLSRMKVKKKVDRGENGGGREELGEGGRREKRGEFK